MNEKLSKYCICNSIGTTNRCADCGAKCLHYEISCEKCPVNENAKCNDVYILKYLNITFQGFKTYQDMIFGDMRLVGKSETFFKGETKAINRNFMQKFLEKTDSSDNIIISFSSLLEIMNNPVYMIIFK